jgi:hypothetical protein
MSLKIERLRISILNHSNQKGDMNRRHFCAPAVAPISLLRMRQYPNIFSHRVKCNFIEKGINFISKLKNGLIKARDKPDPSTLGILWVSETHFAVNSKQLAELFQITQNDLCYNFRSHNFTTESTRNCSAVIKSLGIPKQCKLHSHELLNVMTIETDFDKIQWEKPLPILKRKPPSTKTMKVTQQNETSLKLADPPAVIQSESCTFDKVSDTLSQEEFLALLNLMTIDDDLDWLDWDLDMFDH